MSPLKRNTENNHVLQIKRKKIHFDLWWDEFFFSDVAGDSYEYIWMDDWLLSGDHLIRFWDQSGQRSRS